MKFKIKPLPKLGDKKEKLKLALWPIKIDDTWIWMEYYLATYTYVENFYPKENCEIDVKVEEWKITKKQLIYEDNESRSI